LAADNPEGIQILVQEYTSPAVPSLEITRFIPLMRTDITKVAKGSINLGTTLIFTAGRTRICASDATFHHRYFECVKELETMREPNRLLEFENALEQGAKFICEQTGLNSNLVLSIIKSQRVINTEEAFGLGIVNRIERL